MSKLLNSFLILLCILIALEYVAAQRVGNKPHIMKCYQCNSYYDKGCADYFDNRTYPLIPCKPEATMCRKIVQETFYDGKWDIRYIRQCAILGEVGPDKGRWCNERTGTYRIKIKTCHCDDKDGCNTASQSTIPFLLIAFSTGLLFLYNRNT